MRENRVEILAPAGSLESAYAAMLSGADALYLGLTSFSARSNAENFDMEGLRSLLGYAHAFGVRVHVAMNTLVKQDELDRFLQTAVDVWNCGADAMIIQDIFIGKYLKELYPQMVLHLSTQAGVCNAAGARLAKSYGFDRVILARETKIEDIAEITKIIETEVFVQGALCTCFSGHCYLSSFAGGNSGNRGKCKQPCRKRYTIDRKGFEESRYAISLADLSVGEDIAKLIALGVTSFKIEGRMRRPEYVAAAVEYYGKLVYPDRYKGDKESYFKQLKRMYNRGNYTKGLACGQDKSFVSSAVQGHIGEFVGFVKVINGKFLCVSQEKFEKGDGFKILRDGKEVGGAVFGGEERGGFLLLSRERLKNGDKVFITTDASLISELSATNNFFDKVVPVEIEARFVVGERAKITIGDVKVWGDEPLQEAQNRALSEQDLRNNFAKRDKFPFEAHFKKVKIGNAFVPMATLNGLRRKAYTQYFNWLATRGRATLEKKHSIHLPKTAKNNKVAVIAEKAADCDILIYKPADYSGEVVPPKGAFETFLYLPPYLSGKECEEIRPKAQAFDGIFAEGFFGMQLAKVWNLPLFAGTGFNLSNSVAVQAVPAKYIALSKELTATECAPLCTENTFMLTAGDIQVMDLVYCPFEKSCAVCDKRKVYTLTDDEGRAFPLRRYHTSECRFELFNCAKLVADNQLTGVLLDCSVVEDVAAVVGSCRNVQRLKELFKTFTKGHWGAPVG